MFCCYISYFLFLFLWGIIVHLHVYLAEEEIYGGKEESLILL